MTLVALPAEPDEPTLDQIKRCIDGPHGPSRIFTITPLVAEALLREYNFGNRPEKKNHIARYAAAMQASSWALTSDTIKFSDAKRLRDGQNRLRACLRAGVSFRTHVAFGVPDEFFNRMDQGKNRDGSDLLAIAGYQNCKALAAAVRWADLIETGRVVQRLTYQPPDILRLLQERYSRLPDFLHQARAVSDNTDQPLWFVIAILYELDRANSRKAEAFATAWASGNWAGRFKAIGLLQSKLGTIKTNSDGSRVNEVVRAALVIKAWNIFVANRRGRKIDLNWSLSEDPFPEIAGGEHFANDKISAAGEAPTPNAD